jgi:putative NADPH-quinone reductase
MRRGRSREGFKSRRRRGVEGGEAGQQRGRWRMLEPFVVLGTARQNGDTERAINLAFSGVSIQLVNVKNYNIGGYDYDHKNSNDDFLGIVDNMLSAERIVFATPVYWYAMSSELKTFMDRLSDLVTIKKENGRFLKGKRVWLIATGVEDVLPEGFEIPFKRTADYLDMRYCGAAYLYTGDNQDTRARSEQAMKAFGRSVLEEL